MKIVFTQPLHHKQCIAQGQFLKPSKASLNSDFSFSKTDYLTKAEEPSLSYYLPEAERRKDGVIFSSSI